MSGKLIVIEGLDGAGKSTLADGLEQSFSDRAELVRYAEPGGTPVGDHIRRMLKDTDLPISDQTEALLFAAARAQLAARLREDLSAGRWVILDRWLFSSVAYQGAARGLGEQQVLDINRWATQGLKPDAWIYLSLSLEEAERRRALRGLKVDRIEAEDRQFFSRVAEAYAQLADSDPRAITLSAELPPELLLSDALKELSRLGI